MTTIMLCAALFLGQTPPVYDTPDLGGKLYKSVFVQGAGELKPADLVKLPPEVKTRLDQYLKRRGAFKSGLPGGADNMMALAVEAKRRRVESGIVSMIDAPAIEQAAIDFASDAKILYEWEGKPDGPLAEAAYAETVLKQNPSTPIAPYLYLFIAHRERAAFETMNAVTQKDEMTAVAKKYRTFIQRARSADDPIFKLLADDLDRQPQIYVKNDNHPRNFGPEG
jgi:hypothetical protein